MKLTPTQRLAIEHGGGNLQLIACAGSAKTEVVARRVVHLLAPGEGAQALFDKIEFSEKQIEISLGDGVNVIGRAGVHLGNERRDYRGHLCQP
jgi:hypothetical protein